MALPDVYDGSLPPAAATATSRSDADSGVPLGARIAGALLVINGIAVLIERAMMKAGGGVPGGIGVGIFDIALGAALAANTQKVLTWTRVRVALGMLILPVFLIARGETLQAGFQVFFSGGLLLLLLGRAGAARIALGGAAVGLFLLLETAGLVGMAMGGNPLAALMMTGQLEPGAISEMDGSKAPYRVRLAGDGWRLRKEASARRDNPLADRWAVWPSKDAHVIVVAEAVDPGLTIDMDRFQEVVLANARQIDPAITVLGQSDEFASGHHVRMIQARAKTKGLAVRMLYGLHILEGHVIQVISFVPETAADEDMLALLHQSAVSLQPL